LQLRLQQRVVVRRALIEAGQHRPRPRRHIGSLIVVAGEGSNLLQGVEQQDGGELHLVVEAAPQRVGAVVAVQVAGRDAGQDLLADDSLVGVGVLGCGPAPPDPSDHRGCSCLRR
jgi:hypothetical protein